MGQKFADLHAHPTLYNFNRLRNSEIESDPARYHPWTVPDSHLGHMAQGERAQDYAQSDIPKLVKSGTRLVYASICPIEKGFFQGPVEDGQDVHSFPSELAKLASGVTLVRTAAKALSLDAFGAAKSAAQILANRGPLRQLVQRFFLKYTAERVSYLAGENYHYWGEFWREYEFLRTRDGVPDEASVAWVDAEGVERVELVRGAYHLVKSAGQLESLMASDSGDVALLHTIEGAYVFTIGPDGKRVSEEEMFGRIEDLKSLKWPLLFLTVAHHFDNGICGHAHSMPDAANLVMDQSARLNQGFERGDSEIGMRVIRALLDLDEHLDEQGGRRVLIDCKHFSARARKEYYEEVVRPYNACLAGKSAAHRRHYKPIPVFMSHIAYSGVELLDTMIENVELETDHYHASPYYAWNINASADDVRMVHETGGLLGLVFDQRVCGVAPNQKVAEDMWPSIVRAQIFGMVDVVMADDRMKKKAKIRIWDCLCLGTDFDGLIDPLSPYPTCLHVERFAEDLRAILYEHRHTRYIEQIGVDELVNKICWDNAYRFALRHLPAASGAGGV